MKTNLLEGTNTMTQRSESDGQAKDVPGRSIDSLIDGPIRYWKDGRLQRPDDFDAAREALTPGIEKTLLERALFHPHPGCALGDRRVPHDEVRLFFRIAVISERTSDVDKRVMNEFLQRWSKKP